jgi:hypothetical protein
MKHLTEEELVEKFYGVDAGGAGLHLRECAYCAAAFEVMESDLATIRPMNVPERDENYEERMWGRVEGALPARRAEKPRVRRVAFWRTMAYAAGCAVLVAGAFYGGRVYEHREHQKRAEARAKMHPPAPQPKVVVVVLGDHLDRSERLLVELKHADAESPELVNPLREEARGLLAANHEFRDDAEKEGDPALSLALSHLDKLLTEVATQPGGLDSAALVRIKDEMNADGLLFEVRVLRSKNPHRTKTVRLIAKGGVA